MEYTELCISVESASDELKERLLAELSVADFESVLEEEDKLKAYIPSSDWDEQKLSSIMDLVIEHALIIQLKTIPPQNWNSIWEKNFEPVIISEKCVIRADFHPKVPDMDYDILINPKMAFGTGHHQTTELMIMYILDIDFTNKRVLDMGTGTGILAIIAAKRGAMFINAIDIDPNSVENAKENIRKNHTQKIVVELGNASLLSTDNYDYIFANINKSILLHDMSFYSRALRSGGTLIISGFFKYDTQDLINVASNYRLIYRNHKSKNNWAAVSFQKK